MRKLAKWRRTIYIKLTAMLDGSVNWAAFVIIMPFVHTKTGRSLYARVWCKALWWTKCLISSILFVCFSRWTKEIDTNWTNFKVYFVYARCADPLSYFLGNKAVFSFFHRHFSKYHSFYLVGFQGRTKRKPTKEWHLWEKEQISRMDIHSYLYAFYVVGKSFPFDNSYS